MLSDGWDRGDPDQLAAEMARLARCSHSLIWLNPLKAHEGYEPLTRGMRAALPHVDHFLAGQLDRVAGGAGGADGRRTRMKDVIKDVDAWVARGDEVALATVIDVKRSAPRPPGAKMAVNSRGEVSGAVSGGCVEGAVVAVAEDVLRAASRGSCTSGSPTPRRGTWAALRRRDRRVRGALRAVSLQSDFATAERAALVTVVSGAAPRSARSCSSRPTARARARSGTRSSTPRRFEFAEELMWAERSERREVGTVSLFVDVMAPPPRLIMFGAVDFAGALCRMARAAGWRPYVIDPRGRFATRERFPEAEEIIVAWPEEAFAQIGGIDRATYIAVLTHDPKLDDAALELAVRSEAAYIGAMGSRRAQEKRRERLLERGLTEDELARIAAPIGLDLGGLTAEETALSIMAEVVAVRNGRSGGRLSSASGRIHEVGT